MRIRSLLLGLMLAGLAPAAQAMTPVQLLLLTSHPAFVLDATGTAAACRSGAGFSVRQLTASYGGQPLIQLRRDSDNATQKEYPLWNGNLNVGAIRAWKGAANLFVPDWYDECGSHRDASQSTAANQPGLTLTGGANGKPYVNYPTSSGPQYLATASFTLVQPAFVQIIVNRFSFTGGDTLIDGFSGNTMRIYDNGTAPNITAFAGASGPNVNTFAVGTWGILSALFSGSASTLALNNGAPATGNVGSNSPGGITLGNFGPLQSHSEQAGYEELLVFPATPSAPQLTALHANQKSYYGTP